MKRRAFRRPDLAHSFIKEHNQEPRPFVWRADPDEIIAAARRGRQTSESIRHQAAGRFEILGVSRP
jgi:hypothetical protein